MPVKFGGSFAPPLSKGKLATYEKLALECQDRRVKDEMQKLIKMMKKFQETPESPLKGSPHPVGPNASRGGRTPMIVMLEDKEVKRIFEVVPWEDECELVSEIFSKLPSGSSQGPGRKHIVTNQTVYDLRNAAFHLLWFARELAADREPLTNDKL